MNRPEQTKNPALRQGFRFANLYVAQPVGCGSRPPASGSGDGRLRPVVGTAAVRDPELVKSAARKFPGRVAVGLDARDGKVAVEGWAETSQVTALEIAQRFEDAGVAAIIFFQIVVNVGMNVSIMPVTGLTLPFVPYGGSSLVSMLVAVGLAQSVIMRHRKLEFQ